jgi:hypothetical protein
LAYLDGNSFIRVSQFDGNRWSDVPLGGDYFTHTPGLGIFKDGSLIVAGHSEGWPPQSINRIQGSSAGWGPWEPLVQLPADGSQVFRWAGAFSEPGSEFVDLVLFDEDTNDDGVHDDQTLYYLAVPPVSE